MLNNWDLQVANITTAIAVGALTGGAGAAAMAGVMAGTGATNMTKGSIEQSTEYHETIVANNLTGNNISITSGNDTRMISTNFFNIDGTTNEFDKENINSDINTNNGINLNISGNLNISTATEQHISEYNKEEWGGDLSSVGRAMISGAITGGAVGYGMELGKFAGKFASSFISNTISGSIGSSIATGVGGATNSMTLAFSNTIGSAMSNTTINGGSFRDVLTSGRDSIRDTDTLKSIGISGLTAGLTQGLTQYLDTSLTNNIISKGNIALNPNATLTQRLTSALYESALSTTTNTSMQSLFNKEHSFKDILKRQAVNTGVGALANLGAQEIGKQYHSGNLEMGMNGTMGNVIGKTTQLTLHAGLGALSNKLTGNDALSGAISGVAGELTGEYMKHLGYDKNTGGDIAGLTGGLSALITGKLSGLDNQDIANNMFAGQRLGEILAENNAFGDGLIETIKDINKSRDFIAGNDNDSNNEEYQEQNIISDDINTLLALNGVAGALPTIEITLPKGLSFMDGEYDWISSWNEGFRYGFEVTSLTYKDSYGLSGGFGNIGGEIFIHPLKLDFGIKGSAYWFKGFYEHTTENGNTLGGEVKVGGGGIKITPKGVDVDTGFDTNLYIKDSNGNKIEIDPTNIKSIKDIKIGNEK